MNLSLDFTIISYPAIPSRLVYLELCLRQIRKYVLVSNVKVRWICSVETDGVDEKLRLQFDDLCDAFGFDIIENNGKAGMANNINNVLCHSDADFVFIGNDDRVPKRIFPLHRYLNLMTRFPDVAGITFSTTVLNPENFISCGRIGDLSVVARDSPWSLGVDQLLVPWWFRDKYGLFVENERHGWASMEMARRLDKQYAMILFTRYPYFYHCGSLRCDGKSPWEAG